MAYTFAVSPSDVATDQHGNPLPGRQFGVRTAETWGQPVAVTSLDGIDRDGVTVSDAQGRFGFTAPDETGPVLWLDDGGGRRWPVVAIETATQAFGYIGQVSDAYGAATRAAEAAEQSASAAAATAGTGQIADDAEADANMLTAATVTLDELYVSAFVPAWVTTAGNIHSDVSSAGMLQTIFIAPFALRVHSATLAWEYWGIEASNTSYWELSVWRKHWDGDTAQDSRLARSTTQVSGDDAGGAVIPRTSRTIPVSDEVVYSAGDLMLVGFLPSGSPAQMNYSVAITVSYSPA